MTNIHKDSTCRICLENIAVNNIFSTKTCSKKMYYYEIMSYVFSQKISPNDGLPPKICLKCKYKLGPAYKFKLLADNSYSTLIKHLSKTCIKDDYEDSLKSEIKVENDSFDIEYEVIDVKSEMNLNKILSENLHDSIGITNNNDSEVPLESDTEYAAEDDTPLIFVDAIITEILTIKDINQETNPVSRKKGIKRLRKSHFKKKEFKDEKEANVSKVCHLCGKQVKDMSGHLRTHTLDGNKKTLPCGDCPKMFISHSSRKRHQRIHHLGERYYCEICQKHFKHRKNHVDNCHSDLPKRFGCLECGKHYRSNAQLSYHLSSHSGEKPFPCSLCPKTFTRKKHAHTHLLNIHKKVKNHICQYCSKGFFFLSALKVHIRSHTKERIYKCKECEKKFTTSSILRMHMMRHAGIKKVICDICQKEFINLGALRVHMISHTKEKKHACKYCGMKFGRTDHRNRHEKTAHETKLKFS